MKNDKLLTFNMDNSIVRFEWLELMVRLAVAKYGKGQYTNSVAEALSKLLTADVQQKLPAEYCMDVNAFRTQRVRNNETTSHPTSFACGMGGIRSMCESSE